MADRKRFRGFISYSQQDKAAAQRLHAWLENYRVPLGLAVELSETRRLGRFFRDEEEMGAAANIGASVRGAIEEAESLIVVCSPRSAQSKWVNAEILHFRNTGRGGKVFAVIIDGVPNSGNPATECFPPALTARVPADDPEAMPIEPLGLDIRKEGRARACARLAAGLLDVEFDALWQREKRRRNYRLAAAGTGAAAVLGAVAAIVVPAQLDAEHARRTASDADQRRVLSERDASLRQIAQELGEGEAEAALRQLALLRQRMPADERVRDVASVVLGWARAPQEAIADAAEAGVFWTGAEYLARAPGGVLYPLSSGRPKRSIGLSRERMLLVLEDRISVVNERTGQTLQFLGEADLGEFRSYEWNGEAFEAPTGDLLLMGRHIGVSNGSTYPAVMAVPADGGVISITLPMLHPQANGDTWVSRADGLTAVAGNCMIFGVEADKKLAPSLEGAYFTYDVRAGLSPRGFERLNDQERFYVHDRNAGCTPLRYDTVRFGMPLNDAHLRFGGQIIGVRLSDSPPAPSAWTLEEHNGDAISRYGNALAWGDRPSNIVDANPCMTSACPTIVLGDFNDDTFMEGPESGTSGWVKNARPAGQSIGASALAGEPLYTYLSQDNHSFVGAWCRKAGSATRCFYDRRYMDLSGVDLNLIDTRSASGRYLAYPAATPLKIMDLVDLREVSPAGRPIAAETGLVDFDRNVDARMFAAVDGRLEVLEPDAAGRFESISSTLAWPRDLTAYGRLTRLVSMPEDDVLLVAESGKVVRLAWRTGQVRWISGAPGLGSTITMRLSPTAQWMAVFGKDGVRLLRMSDGLLASGILHPPETLQAGAEKGCEQYGTPMQAADLLSDALLSDDGTLSVWCGRSGARFKAAGFSGDIDARLGELSAGGGPPHAASSSPNP